MPQGLGVVFATAGYDHSIRFWDAPSGMCSKTIPFAESQVNKLAVSPDKRFIIATGHTHVKMFDIASGNSKPVRTFDGHTHNVTSVGFNIDGTWIYTGSEDGTVKVWDVRSPAIQRDYENKAAVNTVALHPKQGQLISGDQVGVVQFWDLASNCCQKQLSPLPSVAVRSISVSPDGGLLSVGSNSGQCFVCPLRGLDPVEDEMKSIKAHAGYLLKCLISSDGKYIATTGADRLAKLWRTSDLGIDRTLQGHHRWVWDCAFSADSAYLITASSDCTAKLWDARQGMMLRSFVGHTKAVTAVALNDITVPDA